MEIEQEFVQSLRSNVADLRIQSYYFESALGSGDFRAAGREAETMVGMAIYIESLLSTKMLLIAEKAVQEGKTT